MVSTGNALPAPVIIGRHGVLPPAQNIYGGGPASVDVTTDPTFDPSRRALALVDTIDRLPPGLRYDYVFDGDSETLSGLLVSPALNRQVAWAQPVHINADFANQTSDHDPLIAYINPRTAADPAR